MPFYQNKPPTLTHSALLKNPGAVIATDVLQKDMDYFESTYHHTFTFDLGDLANTCGNLSAVRSILSKAGVPESAPGSKKIFDYNIRNG